MAGLATGRHTIVGDEVFALVQEYRTKSHSEGFWESHRKYIDVQYMVRGAERMGYANLASLAERQPYDADKDLLILDGSGDFFTVPSGHVRDLRPAGRPHAVSEHGRAGHCP